MSETPTAPVANNKPVETLDEAVVRFHAAVDAAQAAGWRVTITVADDKTASASIKVSVTRRIER